MSTLRNTFRCVCVVSTLLLTSSLAIGNNVSITNTFLTGQDNSSHFILVQFTLSWENSFRDNINYDAVWILVKYRTASNTWAHATLNATGHTVPAGFTATTSADGKGVFIYRNGNGSGDVSLTGVRLQWNYGVDGVADNESKSVSVYAIEMVYVPGGVNFNLGDGVSSNSFKDGSSSTPFLVTGQGTITLGSAAGNLNWTTGNNSGSPFGSTVSTFPTGYNAFYCMKNELTQEQYVEFLNSLTFDQQLGRTAARPDSLAGTRALGGSANRNGIEIRTPGVASITPAVYACDLNNDGNYNQPDDGQNIPCNGVGWDDGIAYADWAALRPMTELEYEKACRGDQPVVGGEYAWGDSTIVAAAYALSGSGTADEAVSSNYSTTVGSCSYATTDGSINGPVRTGIFGAHASNTGRVTSGATYYGVMEMSGNLNERCVTVATSSGRLFAGTHGDGVLTSSGNANASTWPNSFGAGSRGGNWNFFADLPRVSDRTNAAQLTAVRSMLFGVRCVRTAP